MLEGKAKILIADNQPENLQIMENILKEKNGYELVIVASGDETCKIAAKELPDLIIINWDIPILKGLETVKNLHNDNATKDIPIIIIAGVSMSAQEMETAFSTGVKEYLRKPIEGVELITRVRSMLELSDKFKEVKQLKRSHEKEHIELNERNEELETFSHTIAHDLKTPLNNMMCYLTILQDGWENLSAESSTEYINGVTNMIIDMAQIIDNLMLLLSVHKIGEIKLEEIDSEEIIKKILSQNDILLKEKKSEIILQDKIHRSLGYTLWVEEVWSNIISNTIRYGGNPLKIEIGSELKGKFVYFWIKDNGPGITIEDQELIFNKFTSAHKNSARGHGLGLSIVARIINKLGGEAGIEKSTNDSTKFYFTLPAV